MWVSEGLSNQRNLILAMPRTTIRWLTADVARILDEAVVSHILFGWMAVSLVGKDFGFQIEFVVPDSKLQSATGALMKAGFPLCNIPYCSELEPCRNKNTRNHDEMKAKNRHHPVAACHFHIMKPGQALVSLHKESKLLWWLPQYTASDDHLWLSTDSRLHLGTCPWLELYPIKLLNPKWLVKAVLTLLCRDGGQPQTGWEMWYSMAQCLVELEKLASGKRTPYFQPELKPACDILSVPGRVPEHAVLLLRQMYDQTITGKEPRRNNNLCV
ncbi:hypothetical protein BJX65DRAFT_266706 [Aspergillus insuetus]